MLIRLERIYRKAIFSTLINILRKKTKALILSHKIKNTFGIPHSTQAKLPPARAMKHAQASLKAHKPLRYHF